MSTMQKIVCIKENSFTRSLVELNGIYYVNTSDIFGDSDGVWYGTIYRDERKKERIGRFRLSHFKSFV